MRAGKIIPTASVLYSRGTSSFTSASSGTGIFTITYSTAYPTSNPIIMITPTTGYNAAIEASPTTSKFIVYITNTSIAPANGAFFLYCTLFYSSFNLISIATIIS